MTAIRRLVLHRPALAALMLLLALAMRAIVPAGYMIDSRDGRSAITLCPGVAAPVAMQGHAAPDIHHAPPADPAPVHDKPDQPCSFAGLSVPWLGGAELSGPLGAIPAITAPIVPPFMAWVATSRPYWRPPPQGPPLT